MASRLNFARLGKAIGGGFPLAAVAGRKDMMDHFDKAIIDAERWPMILGRFSGNPVAAVAGLKTMEILRREGVCHRFRKNGGRLMDRTRCGYDCQGRALAEATVCRARNVERACAQGYAPDLLLDIAYHVRDVADKVDLSEDDLLNRR